MTLGAMIAKVLNDLRRVDITADASAAITTAVNYYERVRFYFSEGTDAFTSSASQAYYDPPANLKGNIDEINIVLSGIKTPLEEKDYDEIDRKDDGILTGIPSQWAFYKNQIRLWPIPDQKYVLNRSYMESVSLSATASPWLNDAADLIRFRADKDLSRQFKTWDMVAQYDAAEKEEFNSLMAETTAKISAGKVKKSGF